MRRLLRIGALGGSAGPRGTFTSVVGATQSAYGAATSRTLGLPVGATTGDQLVAVLGEFGASSFGTWTVPSGWTQLAETIQGQIRVRAYVAPEGSGLTFTLAPSSSWQGIVVAVRGGVVAAPEVTSLLTGSLTFGLPGGSPQFAIAQNWDGLPHGDEPPEWSDLVTPTGIMAVGTVTAGTAGAFWKAINESDTVPAQALAFSGA